jgi:crotonobetaine/carnitine-CoA ligase
MLTFIDDRTTVSLTNAEFDTLVNAAAEHLIRAGLRPGDTCILHTGNTTEFVVLLGAIVQTGGVVVPTIAMSTASELAYVIEHSEARLLLTTQELFDLAERAALGLPCNVYLTSSVLSQDDEVSLHPGHSSSPCPAGTAILMYTSGTSGRPKGVLLSRAAIDYTVVSYSEHLRLREDDIVLICMPLFHVNGMMLQLLPAIVSGAHIVLVPKFSASNYWRWVAEHHVTVGHLVSGPVRLLLGGPDTDRATTMRAMTFGLPLTDEEISAFQHRFDVPLLMVWGLTETCCGATLMGLGQAQRPEYQNLGQPLRGWDVKAIDTHGEPVAAGEHGELLVGSPGIMTGYHRDPQTTERTLRDGYVATGDLGYVDADGYVHFVSRIKDMLKPRGENVAAQEIADVLSLHPGIEEAAVFGIDDPITIEKVIAAVVLVPGADVTMPELREHCAKVLAPFKVPSEIYSVASIPKTSIGKQQIGELKSKYVNVSSR